jgi:hypothetical protein
MTPSPKHRARRRAIAVTLATVATLGGAGAAVYALAAPAGTSASRAAALRASRPLLTIRAQPSRRTIAPGATATYRIRISRGSRLMRPAGHSHGRRRLATLVSLRTLKPMPRGVTATLRRKATRSSSALLTIRTKRSIRPGSYRVRLSASGRLGAATRHRTAHARTSVVLVVWRARLSGTFTVGGSLAAALAPGRVLPLDLVLTNPHPHALQIGHLAIRIAAVHAPRADAAHPCSTADFAVAEFSGAYGFELKARTTTRLSALRIPSRQWPRVAMLNRAHSQDGCKSARLALNFDETGPRGDG